MLRVRAIKKFHDDKGILIGYTIQDEVTGQKMDVYKNNLKQAIINKQCEVVNMTLTSDGRLIGKAAPAPKRRNIQQGKGSSKKLLEVYTNGRHMVAGLVEEKPLDNVNLAKCNGIELYHTFDTESEIMENIKNNVYENVRIVDGKPDMKDVKRKSFSKVKHKLVYILKNNGAEFSCKVEKSTTKNKYEYAVVIEGFEEVRRAQPLVKAVYCLIGDACVTNKIKLISINDNIVTVSCLTGINDVRRALKTVTVE